MGFSFRLPKKIRRGFKKVTKKPSSVLKKISSPKKVFSFLHKGVSKLPVLGKIIPFTKNFSFRKIVSNVEGSAKKITGNLAGIVHKTLIFASGTLGSSLKGISKGIFSGTSTVKLAVAGAVVLTGVSLFTKLRKTNKERR